MKMKNIITLRDYIQQAEKSHSLERKQIIDLLDSNNPEILHQLCLAAGRCRRRWLFHETQLVCFFDFGEEAPDADGTERLILKAENAGFSKIILKRKQGDDFQTALWQHIANKCRQRRMQLILSLDKFNLTDINRLKDSGVYGFRCEAGTFNKRIYRRIHKSKTSGNFSYLLKCLENIHDCGADLTIGFAVGIPGTTTSDIASDILYLPQLRLTLVFSTVLCAVQALDIFRECYLLAGSYPAREVYTLQHYLYNCFHRGDYASAASALYALLPVIAGLVWLLLRGDAREKA